MQRTFQEINEKIKSQKINVLTANEAKSFIADKGIKHFFENVDLVTCASFEMHTNALLYLNFGQTDPLIYFSSAKINDIDLFPVGPSDLVLSCVSESKEKINYGGAHLIEELISHKDVHLKATGKNLEVFPKKEFETWFNINDLNQARLMLNQAVNQNSILACNSGDKDINSNMGTLIGKLENSTFNSTSHLNPLINDPYCKTIGVGSRIWVGGAYGTIIGQGSNHNPTQKRNEFGIPIGPAITLSAIANAKDINPKWIRGGYIKSFGPVLYIGIAIPIPILNEEIAHAVSISDENIFTTIVDYSIPRRSKPTFGQCSYKELRTSTVLINKKPTLTSSIASLHLANEITGVLKDTILRNEFYVSEPVSSINMEFEVKKMDERLNKNA